MQDRRKQGGRTGENPSPRGRETPSEPAFPQYRKGMILPKGTAADGAEALRFRGAERRGGGAGGGVSPPHEERLRIAQRCAIVPRRKRPVREKRGGSAGSIARKRGTLSPPPRSSPCRKPPPNSAARSAAGVGRGEGYPLPTKSDCASHSDAQSSRGESASFVKNAAVPQALSPGNAGRFRRGRGVRRAESPLRIPRRGAPRGWGVGRGVPSPRKAIAHRTAMRNRPAEKAPRS